MSHIPVMLKEITEIAKQFSNNSTIIDATYGGGGHSEILSTIPDSNGLFIGIDRDPTVLNLYKDKIQNAKCEVFLKNIRFSELPTLLKEMGIFNIDFILADLGVSSFQLDEQNRGFSFMQSGPLDMRMGLEEHSLLDKLKNSSFIELKRIIKKYGEEPAAHKIASAIMRSLQDNTLHTTLDLANIIERSVKKKKIGKHPATKTFQALRIWVNNELEEIKIFLEQIPAFLSPNGILAIITFHSLEDRLVKKRFKQLAHPEYNLPPDLPLTKTQMPAVLFEETGPILPTQAEIESNNRSRSAKLRILKRKV